MNETTDALTKILIVDDDVELCALVAEYLAMEGFQVEAVHRGPEGVERALSRSYALAILDVMLPGCDGIEVLRRIRAAGCTLPIVMLTARGADAVDRIVGLEVGADDYLPKPFNPRELTARIRAILRRTESRSDPRDAPQREASQGEQLRVGDVALDLAARTAWRGTTEIALTAAEFDLLGELLRHAGKVVTRDQLMRAALGRGVSAYDRSVDMHLSNVRRKLGASGACIKAIRSVGYLYALASSVKASSATAIPGVAAPANPEAG